MARPPDEIAFDRFPRGELRIGTPRRKFLSSLMTEITVYNHKADGRRTLKLTDLGVWSDEDLYSVTPILIPGVQVELKEGYLCGTAKGRPPLMLFPTGSPALTVFYLFDGVNTLTEIADTLKNATGWSEEKAFAYTRGVFLSLVAVEICQPKW